MDAEKLIQVVILGIVQGIAEFLPISSSGHLVIVESLLPGESSLEESLTTNIALHLGTLGSILFVYRKDWGQIITNWRLLMMIVLATIPIVIVGISLKDLLEQAFNTPAVAATGLFVTAALLWFSEGLERKPSASGQNEQSQNSESVESSSAESSGTPSWKQALIVGLFQAVAIIPGISRSGSTIAGGVMSGISREQATKFSFLIAIPAISGATLLQVVSALKNPEGHSLDLTLVVGALVAFLVGIVALEGLLKIVRQRRLRWFSIYCLTVAVLTWGWILSQQSGA